VYDLDCHLWHPLFLELTARGCTAMMPKGQETPALQCR
jgi:hypothetical protein